MKNNISKTSTDQDRELILVIKQGDESALETLFKKYHEPLCQYVWQLTGNTETAKDVVQDVFFKLWTNRTTLDSNKSIRSWLFQSAHNRTISLWRKVGKWVEFHTETETDQISMEEPQNDTTDLVNYLLKQIPLKQRQAFVLNRLHGFTMKEISKLLGISVRGVENRISQAIKVINKTKLKKIF